MNALQSAKRHSRKRRVAKLTIAILASVYDALAKDLAYRWSSQGARLLTCRDLSAGGWRVYQDPSKVSTVVIDGEPTVTEEIKGVLIRLPYVFEYELLHIAPEDRTYVSAEMNAFLIYWLHTLNCPIINNPTPTCLCGPNWRYELWVHAASKAGMHINQISRKLALAKEPFENPSPPDCSTAIVVRNQCFGQIDDTLSEQAISLAKIAGTDLLSVNFSTSSHTDAFFVSAELMPEKIDKMTSDAILECFTN